MDKILFAYKFCLPLVAWLLGKQVAIYIMVALFFIICFCLDRISDYISNFE